jgi:hypothetical protein
MATDQQVQEFVHRIEEGRWVKWIKLGMLFAVLGGMFVAFILDPWYWGLYKGLSHPKAIEQAQIARELARGNGFTTKTIRPLAYSQIKTNKGCINVNRLQDTYYAPLWPMTLAPALRAVKDKWQMTTRDYVYVGDRMVSAVAMIFFFLSIGVNFFTARRLFDSLMGVWTIVTMLACALFWRYSMSGLPQMLMLFLFSCAVYALVRATEARLEERWPWGWLSLVALIFGLLALTHGITIWIFAGTLFFCGLYFLPRWQTVLLMGVIFMCVYSPWMYRQYRVSGSPVGISAYSILYQIRGNESSIMRSMDLDTSGVSPTVFRRKIQMQASDQLGNLFNSLGGCVAAPIFFLALMHFFKSPLARTFRWALLSMWLFALLGMSAVGSDDDGQLSANDLNILFIPMFAAYGTAFLLVLWSHLEINVPLVRYCFYTLIVGISFLPMSNLLMCGTKSPVQWPPYVPPYIAIMRDWTTPDEVIASDMPWAVAWYADRKSLWLPMTIQLFIDLNDYERMGGKIAGIYLTPLSGNKGLISDIVKGDYKEWAPFILRNVNIKDFPLKAVTAMPLDNQCIFYSDRDRWTERVD